MERFDRVKYGYSTGTCAAAAVRGALLMLMRQRDVDFVEIEIPCSVNLSLPLTDREFNNNQAVCSVIKNSGDDPDITNGIKIYARVEWNGTQLNKIETGIGIGTVTKPGLQVPPGQPAINPVPRKMIMRQIEELVPSGKGITVTISAPEGVELAMKTFNPRLGIVGGISILGTSGLVEPKSIDAFKTSLVLALDVAKAQGKEEIVLVPGYLGEKFAIEQLKFDSENIVQMGNYVGFMLEEAVSRGFNKITIIGHIGKLVKIAAGHFDTSSAVVDDRLQAIARYAQMENVHPDLINRILELPTAEAAVTLLDEFGLIKVFEKIALSVKRQAKDFVKNKAEIDCYIYSFEKGLIGIAE